MFGKLTLSAFPTDPIVIIASLGMLLVGLLLFPLITYFKKWTWLWTEFLTSVDHKKIGLMYIIVATIMLLRGFADVLLMRSQQAVSVGQHMGFLTDHHFAEIFSAHGTIMIFFVAMPFIIGFMNLIVPLQIGARDVAFPFLNSLSFWLFAVSALLINVSLGIGAFSETGWLAMPPLSELNLSPGVGVDYYIWSLQISGIGTLLTGVNFIVTIFKMRCPGMALMRMPIFTWTSLCACMLIALAFPILTVSLGLLSLDRYLDMHFFTNGFGGNMMMYMNLIWMWGHPEVYILVLPAFGIYSEIVSTFSQKKLFGYRSMVYATAAITVLSFSVWLHHFFTMGNGANVNTAFSIATMVIAIPTGVKIFNWLFTMYRGRVQFTSPILWTLGFLITFTIGGMTGVLLAMPGADFVLHNSLFLIAHFHNTIIGGVVFGIFAGLTYWFPKMFGFSLNETWGKRAFWCWIIGFYTAFMPLYRLGFMGMTRRLNHYEAATGWHPWLILAAFGALVIAAGIACQIIQLVVSIKNRQHNLDTTGDIWNARTLEWSTSSPAPFYNFATIPIVTDLDAFWTSKQEKSPKNTQYEDIHMPKNTSVGFLIGLFSFLFGFAMVWHIQWMAILGLSGAFISLIGRFFNTDTDYYIRASEIAEFEGDCEHTAPAAAPATHEEVYI